MGVEVRFPFAKWRRNESYGHPWTNMCIFSDVSSWTEIEGKAFFCFSFLLCIFVIINFGRIREKRASFKMSFGSFKSHTVNSFLLKLEEEDHYWFNIKSKNAKYTLQCYIVELKKNYFWILQLICFETFWTHLEVLYNSILIQRQKIHFLQT